MSNDVTIDFLDETDEMKESHLKIAEDVIHKTVEMEKVDGDVEVSVTFVDEKRIQEINREYRDKDQPTDVISFALNDETQGEIDVTAIGMPNMLGDIIVSTSHVREQAEEYGHSYERELGFLIVHGMLHLLGYDHMTESDEKEMFTRQEDILTAYGLTR